jgi:hypothetical protein
MLRLVRPLRRTGDCLLHLLLGNSMEEKLTRPPSRHDRVRVCSQVGLVTVTAAPTTFLPPQRLLHRRSSPISMPRDSPPNPAQRSDPGPPKNHFRGQRVEQDRRDQKGKLSKREQTAQHSTTSVLGQIPGDPFSGDSCHVMSYCSLSAHTHTTKTRAKKCNLTLLP